MRILALVTDAFGATGGIAQSNRDLLRAFSEDEKVKEVIVLARRGHSRETGKIKALKPEANKYVYAFKGLYLMQRNSFDLIFCGHLFMAPLAAQLAALRQVPWWLHLHGIEAWKRPRWYLRNAAETFFLATTVSRFTRRRFLSWAKVAPERVRVLPNTVDERFVPGPKSQELIRHYALEGKQVLLTVARLTAAEHYKGHDRVMEAMSRLKGDYPNLVYVIAGDGNDRPRLERKAAELHLGDDVRFIGFVRDDELPALYRLADVFVMPSTGEGFGVSFLEAAASGVPVIGGRADGSWDALWEGRLGAAINPLDPGDIARAISEKLKILSRKSQAMPFERRGFTGHVACLLKGFER